MNLIFRPTDYGSDNDCEAISRWRNNPSLQRLWVPFQKDKEIESVPLVSVSQIRSEASMASAWTPIIDELAILGGRIVGQITIIVDPPHRKSSGDRIAWPSLIIGEDLLHGRGIVRRFGERIINSSKEIGASHLEAGVFEFNQPIRRLLEKASFKEIARVENITWRDGRSWADVRYERPI